MVIYVSTGIFKSIAEYDSIQFNVFILRQNNNVSYSFINLIKSYITHGFIDSQTVVV